MNDKLKLLMVADTYYPKVDGKMIFMEHFFKRAQADFEISWLVPYLGQKNGENVNFIEPSRWLSMSGYPSMKLSLKNIRTIKKAIKENEIIFIQGPALISYLSMYYGPKLKKKTVFYVHTIAWELFEKFFPLFLNKLFFKLIQKLSIILYNRCDEIIVPYLELLESLKKEGVETKTSVARLGVDIDQFQPSFDKRLSKIKVGIDEHKFVIGFVGRISKEKNTKVLLEAFRNLPHQENLFLLMVGDGPTEQVKPFQEIKNCRMTGFVNNVADYLKAMDIFVMPSLTETTSLTTLEAMSCGLPIIVTKVGFMKEYVIKDYNGLFFPRDSPGMLKTKIEKLIKSHELRDKLGKNARKTVAYSFSWERSINKIKRIINNVYFYKPQE